LAERPDALELLGVARDALLALVTDTATDPRHHYTLRMAANAIAIAGRELALPPVEAQDAALWQRVIDCDARDADAQKTLHGELVAATRAKLAVSNPKFAGGR
jgi:hypothetical protein